MTRFALRGLFTRKLRSVLTAFAIVLGVALVSGTYVLTDSITKAFDSIFQNVYRGTDATITGRNAIDTNASNAGGGANTPSFEQSLLARVRALPDVKAAIGGVSGEPHLVKNGKAIAFGGAPNLGFSVDPKYPQFSSLKLSRGAWPGPNELVVDTGTANKKNIRVGDTIGVQALGPVKQMRVSGLVKFGSAGSLGGATLAGFDINTAQALFDKRGKLDDIRVAARPGVSPQRLVAQIKPILPRDTQVRTGTQQAKKSANATNSFLTFFKTFLLAFAGIALFVGSFVIANSLSITIAQRTREFATLRTLGASRRQILRTVLIEALVVGFLAAVVGLFVGFLLAKGLFSLFDSVGFTLPNSGIVFKSRTAVVAILVGVLVTVAASLRPAVRATRVQPIDAVREGATIPETSTPRRRLIRSAGLTLIGFAALIYGLFAPGLGTGGVLGWMGIGALMIFVGVALLSARWVPSLAQVLGWPAVRIGGAVGRIARENARRNPQRTASTASALMIGLALVTLVAILAAGIISNFKGAVDALFKGDYVVTAQNNFSLLPRVVGKTVQQTPGLTTAASVRGGDAKIFGKVDQLSGVDPTIGQTLALKWKAGSQAVLGSLGSNGAFTDDGYAKKHHLHVGSPVSFETPTGDTIHVVIRGVFKPPAGGSPFGPITVSSALFDRSYQQPQNLFTFINMRGGESAANQAALEQTLKGFPNAKVQNRQKFIDNQISGLKSTLNVLYVLLALSIIVSLFGIVNTLVLSVFERTREIGMLRAVGMTRRQTRRMIRYESVVTALIGTVTGIGLGLVLGALLAARVKNINFTIPVGSLIAFIIAAVIVGLLAAIFPARRAARLRPLEALSYE
ncbi:MAG TPA: FtsX-like permease family protein [Thermoleophilaceae bacterium]|nr:FtsX-like permease family protein [Thermoleophilaceae bacterium]